MAYGGIIGQDGGAVSPSVLAQYGLSSGNVNEVLAMLAGSLKVEQEENPKYLVDMPDGYIYQLHENGVLVDFIKVKSNYISGGTALVRKDAAKNIQVSSGNGTIEWDESSGGVYEGSVADTTCIDVYLPTLDEKDTLMDAPILVYSSTSATASESDIKTINRKVFLASCGELNGHGPYNLDGKKLGYDLISDAQDNNWTRTPASAYTQAQYVFSTKEIKSRNKDSLACIRPMIVLPNNTIVSNDKKYFIQTPTSENVTDEVAQALGSVKVETGSYTGTGTYGSSNPNSITSTILPFLILITMDYPPGTGYGGMLGVISGLNNSFYIGDGSSVSTDLLYVTSFGKTTSWYGGTYSQMNINGKTYHYIIFGLGGES